MVFGGVAVICPECSNRWTLSPAVAISWCCPACGGARTPEASQHLCRCGHRYNQHETHRDAKPSRAAFGIELRDIGRLEQILATDPEPTPTLGRCGTCECERYQLDPPALEANEFLDEVESAAQRGAGGSSVTVTTIDDGALEFREGRRSIRLRVQPDGTIRMGRRGVLTMGRDSVGATVIAIREALRSGAG